MKTAMFLFLTMGLVLSAGAQDVPKVEVPVGFSMINVHPNLDPITSFNVFGGGGQVDFNFGNVFGVKADLFGYTQSSGLRDQLARHGLAGAASGNLFTYMFGPQVKKHTGLFQPFGEALFGAAHTNAYATILTAEGRILNGSASNNAFAFAAGGGIDLAVSKHIALRPVEVDYLFTRFGARNYHGDQNNFRYIGGLNFMFGGAPPVPVSASCSASPTEVYPGDPVTATMNVQNFNPKHTVAYSWSGAGGKLSATSATATIDTTGLAPGTYAAIGTATDPKESKNNKATCSANFAVKARPMNPPQVSCSASPSTVKSGDPVAITASASSPDNAQVTGYAYQASAGTISGTGTSATLDTTGATSGTISVTVTATDTRNLTGTGSCSVGIQTPPPPPACSKINSIQFPDVKRPWRVDNTAKAILDDVASRLKSDPNAKIAIVGYADSEKAPIVGTGKNRHPMNLAAQRAVNAKAYLVQQQGVDPSRVEVRQGTGQQQVADIIWVPQGADENGCTDLQNTTPVDESAVQPSENAYPKSRTAAPAHHHAAAQ
jgi:opacity protein-like surface antigen